jgi:hypothetical protein
MGVCCGISGCIDSVFDWVWVKPVNVYGPNSVSKTSMTQYTSVNETTTTPVWNRYYISVRPVQCETDMRVRKYLMLGYWSEYSCPLWGQKQTVPLTLYIVVLHSIAIQFIYTVLLYTVFLNSVDIQCSSTQFISMQTALYKCWSVVNICSTDQCQWSYPYSKVQQCGYVFLYSATL